MFHIMAIEKLDGEKAACIVSQGRKAAEAQHGREIGRLVANAGSVAVARILQEHARIPVDGASLYAEFTGGAFD